jgi:prepilin-type N-terminal cleavage/methylation domain-containing protein
MSRKGFSTIELVIVIVLIGIIAAIGFPRLRTQLEKQNIRSAKALTATLVATARATAIQRGCSATLNLSSDSIWVSACQISGAAGQVQVGTKKVVGSEFNVTLSPSVAAVVYDPRGLTAQFQRRTVQIIGPHYRDSVVINEVGKVVRQ